MPPEAQQRSSYERFAIPYSFKPQLSVPEAALAAITAFLRIFLGSLLFAVWGTYTLMIWSGLHGWFWRVALALPMGAVFLVCLAVLMVGISAASRWLSGFKPVRNRAATPEQ